MRAMPSASGGSEKAAPELDEVVELVEDSVLLLVDEALEIVELLVLLPDDAGLPVQIRTMMAWPPPLVKKSRTE
jgi:hypothetical protein